MNYGDSSYTDISRISYKLDGWIALLMYATASAVRSVVCNIKGCSDISIDAKLGYVLRYVVVYVAVYVVG